MRLAWFSPLPPVHSGIAAYSLDVLQGLAGHHAIDLYVEDRVWQAAGGHLHAGRGPLTVPLEGPLGLPLLRAYDFPVAQERQPYDLIVYQMGNAACHRYQWPYLLRWPGLVVLHDAALHHARAHALLSDRRDDDYRAEFRFNHPGVDPRVADFVVAGLEGSPYYLWPMLRTVMCGARAVVVHGEPLRQALAEEFPGTPIRAVSMGVPDPWAGSEPRDAGSGPRAQGSESTLNGSGLGAQGSESLPKADGRMTKAEAGSGLRTQGSESLPKADSDVVVAAFGVITPEKRILPILRALQVLRADLPAVRLRLVGEIGEHYALWQDVARTGTRDLLEVTGYVDDDRLAAELRGADVCLCLRWPTARETSASWLRCLAAGKPTIVPDQLSTADVPTLDPRHWTLKHDRTDAAAVFQPPSPTRAVAVSVDLQDEQDMLVRALRRLVIDADLRASLGHNARGWWEARHTLPRMHRDYEAALTWAAAQPVPDRWPADAPAHLHPDTSRWARALVAPFDVDVDILESGSTSSGP
ncbi:glycosyl transferase family 1 [Luteitalea sp. TBR-22]|uniref:glycosyltransferase n=1 Tax=Luteitalea sp. TBR-22 TaxID=2802971 RepID=UPI001EF6CD34|nr:glycosyltransferase [Luteitalea sp. TBR-22]BCS34673.2 glycosyl transferase family 1 [Luteitalea sp. TBR-22]